MATYAPEGPVSAERQVCVPPSGAMPGCRRCCFYKRDPHEAGMGGPTSPGALGPVQGHSAGRAMDYTAFSAGTGVSGLVLNDTEELKKHSRGNSEI